MSDVTTGTDRFRFDPSTYANRRAEVAAMIDEADRQDDTPMGPDGLADALMEIAEGWTGEALNAALTAVEEAVGGMDGAHVPMARSQRGDHDYGINDPKLIYADWVVVRIAALRKGDDIVTTGMAGVSRSTSEPTCQECGRTSREGHADWCRR